MTSRRVDTAAIVRELPPADWNRIALMSKMRPEERIRPILEEAERIRARTKDKFRSLYPGMNEREINLKVLEYLTGDQLPERVWQMARAT